MCNDRDCDCKRSENEYVNRLKDSQAGLQARVGRAFYGSTHEASGQAQSATETYLKSSTKWELRVPQYTPLLVMMIVELHCFPDRRQFYLYSKLPQAQTEIMELLRRAQIVVPIASPMLPGAVQTWDVDDDALKAYIDAVCRVSLPEKRWEVRT